MVNAGRNVVNEDEEEEEEKKKDLGFEHSRMIIGKRWWLSQSDKIIV